MNFSDILGYGERIESSYLPNNWIDRNPSIFRLTSPTILAIGGNDTNSAQKANGYLKFIETVYPNLDADKIKRYAVYYKTLEHKDAVIGKVMSDAILRPLYLTARGTLKPLEEIRLNLANLCIFTHCKGSSVVAEMGKSVLEDLTSFGLSKEEALSATQQIFVLNYAPYLNNLQDNTFNNASFFSGNDQLLISDTYFKRFLISPENFTDYAGCGRIYEKFGNTYFYTDGISPNDEYDDHHIPTIKQNLGYYRCEAMLGCMNKLLRVHLGRAVVSHELGRPIEINQSLVNEEMRSNIARIEEAHTHEEDEYKRINYHPEQLEKYYSSIATFYENKKQYNFIAKEDDTKTTPQEAIVETAIQETAENINSPFLAHIEETQNPA